MAATSGTTYFAYISFDGILYCKNGSTAYGNSLTLSSTSTSFTLGSFQSFPDAEGGFGLSNFKGWYTKDGTKVNESTSMNLSNSNFVFTTEKLFSSEYSSNGYYILPLHSEWDYKDVSISSEFLHKTATGIREVNKTKNTDSVVRFSPSKFYDMLG